MTKYLVFQKKINPICYSTRDITIHWSMQIEAVPKLIDRTISIEVHKILLWILICYAETIIISENEILIANGKLMWFIIIIKSKLSAIILPKYSKAVLWGNRWMSFSSCS